LASNVIKEDDSELKALWANVTVPGPACTLKLDDDGKWKVREVSIKYGILTYSVTQACMDKYKAGGLTGVKNSIWSWIHEKAGDSKELNMNLVINVTQSKGVSLHTICGADKLCQDSSVMGADSFDCVELPTAFRRFVFCRLSSEAAMDGFFNAATQTLVTMGSAGKLAAASSQISRLLMMGTKVPEAGPIEEAADFTKPGIITQNGPNAGAADAAINAAEPVASAVGIQATVSQALALIQADESHEEAVEMLQKAFKAAQANKEVGAYISGMSDSVPEGLSKSTSLMELQEANGWAALSSAAVIGINIAVFILIIAICGSASWCVASSLAILLSSHLEESATVKAVDQQEHREEKEIKKIQ